MTRAGRRPWFNNIELAAGCSLSVALLTIALLAPLLETADPLQGDLMKRFVRVGHDGFLLGSDQLGRDLWSRLIAGLRWSMACALTADIINAVVGVSLGLMAAGNPGWGRRIIRQITDTFQSFPSLIVAIVVVVVIGHGFWPLVLTLGLLSWPIFMRVSYAEASSILQFDYVKAARVAGVSGRAILVGHVLPGLRATLLVVFALNFSGLLIAESALSFLGIGAPLGIPTWGNMLAESRQYLLRAPWLMLVPSLAIILAVVTANLVGDGISAKLRR
jgi:peptide/nickel transport system permease protein